MSRSLRLQYEISFQLHTVPGEQTSKSATGKAKVTLPKIPP